METHRFDREKGTAVVDANAEKISGRRPSDSAVLTAPGQRDRLVPQEAVMTRPIPVTVIVSFRLCADRQGDWYSAWRGLADIAERVLYCHRFDLLQYRDDETRCLVISEWDDRAAFDHFVRRTNLLWLERALGYARCPTEFTFFDRISDDGVREDSETMVETVLSDASNVLASR